MSRLPRKTSKLSIVEPVPQTATGSQVEKTKANELEVPKELGKEATVS